MKEFLDYSQLLPSRWQALYKSPVMDFVSLLERQNIDWSNWTPDQFIIEYAKFRQLTPEIPEQPIKEPEKIYMPSEQPVLRSPTPRERVLSKYLPTTPYYRPPEPIPFREQILPATAAGVEEFINTIAFGLPRLITERILGLKDVAEEVRTLPEYQTPLAQVIQGLGHLGGLLGVGGVRLVKAPIEIGFALSKKITTPLFKMAEGGKTPALSVIRHLLESGASLGIAESLVSWEGETAKEIFTNKIQSYIHGQILGSLASTANFISFGQKYPLLASLIRAGAGTALYDIATGQRPWDERPLLQKVVDYGLAVWMSRRGFSFKDYHKLTQELNALKEELKTNEVPPELLPTPEKILESIENQPIPETPPERLSNKQLRDKFIGQQLPVVRVIYYDRLPEVVKKDLDQVLKQVQEGFRIRAITSDGKTHYLTRIPQPGELVNNKAIKELHILDPDMVFRIQSTRKTEKAENRILDRDVVAVRRYAREVEPPSPPWIKTAEEVPVPNYLRRKIDAIATKIANDIAENKGGGTYSIAFGEITPEKLAPYRPKNPDGTEGELYIASAWAGRTLELPASKITKEVIEDYIYANMDLLSDFSRFVGFGIYNDKVVFDVNTMKPDPQVIHKIAKTQQEAWKLFASESERIGGEGYTNPVMEAELGIIKTRDWNNTGEPLTLYAVSPVAPHSSQKVELTPTYFSAFHPIGENVRLITYKGFQMDLKEDAAPKLSFWTSETPEIVHEAFEPIENIRKKYQDAVAEMNLKDETKEKLVDRYINNEKSLTYYLYKAQVATDDLLIIDSTNPPANPALAAVAAGKKGWFDPVSKEIHLLAPIEADVVGIISKKKAEGVKISGQNIESFADPIKVKNKMDVIDITNMKDDDIVITYRDRPGAFGITKKLLKAIEEVEDLPKKLHIPKFLAPTEKIQSKLLSIRIATENPYYILDYYPEIREASYDLARERIWVEFQYLEKHHANLRKWHKELKKAGLDFKKSAERIMIYGIGKQLGGLEELKKLGVEPIKELTDVELKIYNGMRQAYDTVFPLINDVRKLYGKEPINYVHDYFTFMRNFVQNPDLTLDVLFKQDSDYLHRILSEPYFPYAEKRKGGEEPLKLDAFEVFSKYMEKAYSYISSAPLAISTELLLQPHVVKENGQLKTISLQEKAPQLYNYLLSWRQYVLKYDVPSFLNQFPQLQKIIRRVNKNLALALLAYNVRSHLIQIGSMRNAMVELNPYWFVRGIAKVFEKKSFGTLGFEFATKESHVLKPRIFEVFIQQFYEAPQGSKLRQFLDKFGETGLFTLKRLDAISATITWLGAYEKATKGLKMSHKEAVKWADDVVIKTQASGHRHDLPIIQREDTMRFLFTMFQTFTINEWNFLGERVFGKGAAGLTPQQRFARIFTFLAATAAFNMLFEDMVGIRSPFPAPEKAIKKALEDEKPLPEVVGAALREMAEQVPIIGGAIRWSTAYRTFLPAGMQLMADLVRLVHKLTSGRNPLEILKPEDYSAILKLFGIPGTGEAEKVYRRLRKGMPLLPAILGTRMDLEEADEEEGFLPRLQEFFKRFNIDSFILNLQEQMEKEEE